MLAVLAAVEAWAGPYSGGRTGNQRGRSRRRVFWNHHVGFGARSFSEHSLLTERPIAENGEWGYGLLYEYHESPALWQLVATYAPDSEVLAPEVNLVYEDRGVRGGVGGIGFYQFGDVNEWENWYWQMQLGFRFTLTRKVGADLAAYHVFESWNDLSDFDFDDLDYGVWFRWRL